MNAIKLLPNYTYEDYRHWEGRWELIDGIPFAMSPSPTIKHQWVTANIICEFGNAIRNTANKKYKALGHIDIKVDESTIVQPDCSIVCKSGNENFLDFPPALVVEVLSPSTVLKDRHTKYSIYEKFGVKYYLIADPDKETIEIYCLDRSGYIQQDISSDNRFSFQIEEDCEITVSLENFWE